MRTRDILEFKINQDTLDGLRNVIDNLSLDEDDLDYGPVRDLTDSIYQDILNVDMKLSRLVYISKLNLNKYIPFDEAEKKFEKAISSTDSKTKRESILIEM